MRAGFALISTRAGQQRLAYAPAGETGGRRNDGGPPAGKETASTGFRRDLSAIPPGTRRRLRNGVTDSNL